SACSLHYGSGTFRQSCSSFPVRDTSFPAPDAPVTGWRASRPSSTGGRATCEHSVGAPGAGLVLKDETSDGEDDRDPASGDQPPLPEGDPDPGQRAGGGDTGREVATRAEEADLPRALGDLGIRSVLRSRLDPARDHPEVERAHTAQ